MSTEMKRRVFLQRSLAAAGVAAAAGILNSTQAFAYPKAAFEAKDLSTALKELLGTDAHEPSDKITVKAPDIAENGAVVPITVDASLDNVESIAIIAAANPVPLVANFKMGPGALGFASTRIKMGKTGDVIAVVKADGKVYSASKNVKVTIGGCGG